MMAGGKKTMGVNRTAISTNVTSIPEEEEP